jgi:hypothetical protein
VTDKIKVDIEVTIEQAKALAQFVKRIGFTEFKANAVDEKEAYLIRDGVSQLQNSLSRNGFSPR